jgi:hypothetical protein
MYITVRTAKKISACTPALKAKRAKERHRRHFFGISPIFPGSRIEITQNRGKKTEKSAGAVSRHKAPAHEISGLHTFQLHAKK